MYVWCISFSGVEYRFKEMIYTAIYRSADIPVYTYIYRTYAEGAAKCCQFGPITTLGQLAALRIRRVDWQPCLIDGPPPAMRERETELYALCPTHSGRRTVGMIHVCNILIIASAQTTANYKTTKWKFNENRSELFWLIAVSSCCCCCCCCWLFKGKAMPVKLFTLTLHSSCCCYCSHLATRSALWLLQLTDNESKLNKIKAKQKQ